MTEYLFFFFCLFYCLTKQRIRVQNVMCLMWLSRCPHGFAFLNIYLWMRKFLNQPCVNIMAIIPLEIQTHNLWSSMLSELHLPKYICAQPRQSYVQVRQRYNLAGCSPLVIRREDAGAFVSGVDCSFLRHTINHLNDPLRSPDNLLFSRPRSDGNA